MFENLARFFPGPSFGQNDYSMPTPLGIYTPANFGQDKGTAVELCYPFISQGGGTDNENLGIFADVQARSPTEAPRPTLRQSGY